MLADTWTEERNLRLSEDRETLIYLLGRIGREPIPENMWVFLARHSRMWRPREAAEA
jgi:hypothetical protein